MHLGEQFDGADALIAHRGVRRPPGHLQPEGQRAGVGRHDGLRTRFRDDAHVADGGRAAAWPTRPGRRPPRRRRRGSPAAGRGRPRLPGSRPGRPADATTPAFMSHAPRPCTAPSAMRGTNGSPSHSARSPGGTTSVCPESTSAGTPSSAAGTVPTTPHASVRTTSWPGASGSVAAACRSIGQRVDVAVEFLQPAGQQVLDLALGRGAADRGDGDHPAQPVDQPFLVDGVESPRLCAGQVGHGRSLARHLRGPAGSGR